MALGGRGAGGGGSGAGPGRLPTGAAEAEAAAAGALRGCGSAPAPPTRPARPCPLRPRLRGPGRGGERLGKGLGVLGGCPRLAGVGGGAARSPRDAEGKHAESAQNEPRGCPGEPVPALTASRWPCPQPCQLPGRARCPPGVQRGPQGPDGATDTKSPSRRENTHKGCLFGNFCTEFYTG